MVTFCDDVLAGLQLPQKSIPSKYFYDRRGSELFEEICNLKEYYIFSSEVEILTARAPELTQVTGRKCNLIELGSGSSVKTKFLLDQLESGSAYVPVDVSQELLEEVTRDLRLTYPELKIHPVAGDFCSSLGHLAEACDKRLGNALFFPGSTIGNFNPDSAEDILRRCRELAGKNGFMIIGVDLVKTKSVLEAAYNDSRGVTAAFNLNLLTRMNEELSACFDLSTFQHSAFFNEKESRIEMHLVSLNSQTIPIAGQQVHFDRDETIHTENSYKYRPEDFIKLAQKCGFSAHLGWTDSKGYFSVFILSSSSE